MGHNDSCAVVEQALKGAVKQSLRRRVEARGGLVQDHDVGVAEQDARARQQLRLARGQPGPLGAHDGVEPIRQLPQPLVKADGRQRAEEPCIGHMGVEESQVVAQARVEELHVLGEVQPHES